MAAVACEAPVTPELPSIWDSATKAKQTKAMPKHSLFGTSLELHDDEELKTIRNLDLSVQRIPSERRSKDRYVVPDFIKNHLKGF